MPSPEVAGRGGHGVTVLLKVYDECVERLDNAANELIRVARESSGS